MEEISRRCRRPKRKTFKLLPPTSTSRKEHKGVICSDGPLWQGVVITAQSVRCCASAPNGLRGGIVGDPQLNVGISGMEIRQPPHQKQMQSRFTGTDGNYTVFQPTVLPQLLLSGGELIVGQTHMGKEFFPLLGSGLRPGWSGQTGNIPAPAPDCSCTGLHWAGCYPKPLLPG